VRLEGDDPDALIMHWSGWRGKAVIQRQIESLQIGPMEAVEVAGADEDLANAKI